MLTKMFNPITEALATDSYWTVLGAYKYLNHKQLKRDEVLRRRTNDLKHLLQVNGPVKIPNLINNG